jgi:hypothetical protein
MIPPHWFWIPHLSGSILWLSTKKSKEIHAISLLTRVPDGMYSLKKSYGHNVQLGVHHDSLFDSIA